MAPQPRPRAAAWKALAGACAALGAWMPGTALALPVEGHVAVFGTPLKPIAEWVLGADAELGPRDGPWRVGAAAWQDVSPDAARRTWWGQEQALTLYGRAVYRLAPEHELSLLAGPNYRTSPASGDPYGAVVGASWRWQAERFWVRLTPHHVLSASPQAGAPWTASALPWAELGFRLSRHLGVGLRFGVGQAQVTWQY